VLDFIVSEELIKIGNEENLVRLYKEILRKDWFMTLLDFEEYCIKKEEVFKEYEDRKSWAKKMLINISKAGYFSSDRTITQYNEDIWKINIK
jgi:starch phosphorylase